MSRPVGRDIALLLILPSATVAAGQRPEPADGAMTTTRGALDRPPTVSVWCASTAGARTECRANTASGVAFIRSTGLGEWQRPSFRSTDTVAPASPAQYYGVFDLYAPVWRALTPEASQKVRVRTYQRLFDEARRRVRACVGTCPRRRQSQRHDDPIPDRWRQCS